MCFWHFLFEIINFLSIQKNRRLSESLGFFTKEFLAFFLSHLVDWPCCGVANISAIYWVWLIFTHEVMSCHQNPLVIELIKWRGVRACLHDAWMLFVP